LLEEKLQESKMTENIPKKAFGFETINHIETVKSFVHFVIDRIKLQHALFIAFFLTFGIGDGVTGAYMMEKFGSVAEANPLARYIFETDGFWGVVFTKVWYTLALIFIVHRVQVRSQDNIYWTVNGFLIALTAGGLMAINANLNAIAGEAPQTLKGFIFTYFALVLIFTHMGEFLDKHTSYPEVSIKEVIRS